MPHRIETAIKPVCRDVAGESVRSNLNNFFNLQILDVRVVSVYLIDLDVSVDEINRIKNEILTDNVLELSEIGKMTTAPFDFCIEVGYKPGVTDNLGKTAKQAVSDLLNKKFPTNQKIRLSSSTLK